MIIFYLIFFVATIEGHVDRDCDYLLSSIDGEVIVQLMLSQRPHGNMAAISAFHKNCLTTQQFRLKGQQVQFTSALMLWSFLELLKTSFISKNIEGTLFNSKSLDLSLLMTIIVLQS